MSGQSRQFDRAALIATFEEIGHAAVEQGETLDLFVYGDSAPMLASNFRFATKADVAPRYPLRDC